MGIPPVLPLADIVPHCRQLSSWDCGLACVSMVLSAVGQEHSLMDLRKDCPLESVWTIDLAYLLRRFGVADFTYYTSYIGVNWQYIAKDFYRDTLTLDRRRIHSLFAAAHDNRVRVVALTLSLDDIRRFLLSTFYAVIMLVDLNLLNCQQCNRKRGIWPWCKKYQATVEEEEHIPVIPWEAGSHSVKPCPATSSRSYPGPITRRSSKSTSCFSNAFSCFTWCGRKSYAILKSTDDFVGHYILLIGYDPDKDVFYYRDPGTDAELCVIDGDDLEAARMNDGTDHDVIVARVR